MELKEFRKLFVETSGRYDLMNDDGTNNGADYYINQGLRHLETIMHWDKMEATFNKTLVGVSNFMVQDLRTINKVFARLTMMDKFTELARINIAQARQYVMADTQAGGVPLFYCLFRSRGVHQSLTIVESFFLGTGNTYQDVLEGQNFDSVGMLVLPLIAPSDSVQIEITGLMRSARLVDDTDSNYWTVEWPNVLLYASRRELEVQYRNLQGVKDWDSAITSALVQQEMDYIMDESNQISRMEG